jgi:hypothetical protein
MSAPMSAVNLVSYLAGELLTDPALIVETIKGDEDLLRLFRSYNSGEITYAKVLETLNAYV